MKQQSFVFNHINPELEREVCILVEHKVLDEIYNIQQRHDGDVERLLNQMQVQNKIIKQFNQRIKELEKWRV